MDARNILTGIDRGWISTQTALHDERLKSAKNELTGKIQKFVNERKSQLEGNSSRSGEPLSEERRKEVIARANTISCCRKIAEFCRNFFGTATAFLVFCPPLGGTNGARMVWPIFLKIAAVTGPLFLVSEIAFRIFDSAKCLREARLEENNFKVFIRQFGLGKESREILLDKKIHEIFFQWIRELELLLIPSSV